MRCRNFLKDGLNFRIGIPANGFFFEDQIGAHAAAGELSYTSVVLGAIGVCVEVTWSRVADVLEEFHQPKCRLQIAGAEAQILVEAAGGLVVEIDVKELACFPSLGDAMHEI
jgi:hypothetical protein